MKDFKIKEILDWGWQTVKSNFWYFVGVIGLVYAINFGLGLLEQLFQKNVDDNPVSYLPVVLLNIFSYVLNLLIHIGLLRIALSFCDRVKPSMELLFDGFDYLGRFLLTSLLQSLIVFVGVLLLIVPGIIFALMYAFALYFVVEYRLGPMTALQASARITRGVRFKLLGFFRLLGLLNILGALLLFVGLFVTVPITMLASALVYRHLVAQTPELAELAIQPAAPLPTEPDGEGETWESHQAINPLQT